MYSVYTGSNNRGKPVINDDNDQIELAANSKSIYKMPAFIKEAVALVVLAFHFLVLELQTQVSRFQRRAFTFAAPQEVEAKAIDFA